MTSKEISRETSWEERRLLERHEKTTQMFASFRELHLRGEVSEDDMSRAQTAINESLTQICEALARIADAKVRFDHGTGLT